MSTRRFSPFAILALGIAASACGDRDLTLGLEEPIRIHDAQFVEEELPGSRPLTSAEVNDGKERRSPSPSSPGTAVSYLRERLAGTTYRGFASGSTVALGVRVEDLGTGYWLFPAGAKDPSQNDAITWSFTVDFNESLPAGKHKLLIAAIDEDGKSGTQEAADICVNSLVPDNGNACDASISPPSLVIGARWDNLADLDLLVVTPNGDIVSSKDPSTGLSDPKAQPDPFAPGVGIIDLDSNKDCSADGRNQENLVFQNAPPSGHYLVYVNLHRACAEASVHSEVALHNRKTEQYSYSVRVQPRGERDLIAAQANGSTAIGTFVTEFDIE